MYFLTSLTVVEAFQKGEISFQIIVKLFFIVFVPMFSFFYLKNHMDEVKDEEFQDKFISIYSDIDLNRRSNAGT